MLIIVHSGYVGSWSLYFYIYQATSIKIWQNNLSQQGAQRTQEMGGRGELGWASGSRTQLGVESDNVFIQKVGEEVRADLAVHTDGRGGSWSCLLKACHWFISLRRQAQLIVKTMGRGGTRGFLTPWLTACGHIRVRDGDFSFLKTWLPAPRQFSVLPGKNKGETCSFRLPGRLTGHKSAGLDAPAGGDTPRFSFIFLPITTSPRNQLLMPQLGAAPLSLHHCLCLGGWP